MFFTNILTSLLFFFQMNKMSTRWVTAKIWFIWSQNESGIWSSYFIQISFFFSSFSTKQFIFLPRFWFFSAFSSKQFIFFLYFYLDVQEGCVLILLSTRSKYFCICFLVCWMKVLFHMNKLFEEYNKGWLFFLSWRMVLLDWWFVSRIHLR